MARKKNQTLFTFKTNEEYKDAILKSDGSITTVAKILGVVRQSVDAKLKTTPELKQILLQVREERNDKAENVIKNVMDDDTQDIKVRLDAAKFWLTHMGRNRGWGDVTMNLNLNANIVDVDFDSSAYSVEEKRELLARLSKGMRKEDSEDGIIDGNFIEESPIPDTQD